MVFLLIVFLLCCLRLNCLNDFNLSTIFANSSIEVYVNDLGKGEFKYEKNGDGFIMFSDVSKLDYILNDYNVLGYTITVNCELIESVLQKLNPNNFFNVGKYVYGFKSGLFSKTINNINFQCAKSEQGVLIGVPILLGSY